MCYNWYGREKMKKTILLKIFSCILFLSLMLYPNNPSVYWAEGDIFKDHFTEPCETSYVVFWDGYILKLTSYEGERIDLFYYQFKEFIEERERKIKDIAIKIHNHLPGGSYTLSPGDLKFMRSMRHDGFEGSYCLKPPSGKIKVRRDKNIALTQLFRRKETKKFLKEYKEKYPEAHEVLTDFILKEVAK